jgi:sorbitol-specific phosphotransferase system component IIC
MRKFPKNKTINIILLTGILPVLIGISTFCFNVKNVHASEKLNKTKITMTNKDLKTIKVKNPQKK